MGRILVDFDNTLATYKSGGFKTTGKPIIPMVDKVNQWLDAGFEVWLFTARVNDLCLINEGECVSDDDYFEDKEQREMLTKWCKKHLKGRVLPMTNCKTPEAIVIYDDRARQVKDGVIFNEMELW
jgi:hypothetical protein